MRYKNRQIFILLAFLGCLVFLPETQVAAQTSGVEKRRVKNFGSSLKPKKNKDKAEKPAENDENSDEDDEDVIKVETTLVRTDVLVVDKKGKAILGLKPSDFVITEDGVEQEIGTLTLGDNANVPKSIVLIIDYSGSQMPFIKNSVAAAKVLIDKLNPNDRMAIVTDDVELIVDFTNDKKLLKKKLDSLEEKKFGMSLQFSALMATLNEMFDKEDVRPIIIFQSDGDEAFSISRPATDGGNARSPYTNLKEKLGIYFTISDLFNRIDKSRATIYSVISGYSMLGISEEERFAKMTRMINEKKEELIKSYQGPTSILIKPEAIKANAEILFKQQTAMMIVARASGGFTESLETPEQADTIYSRILNDTNNRYLIGYYPKNQERDGKRRNIKIEVRNHPEYIVWGRKTYIAPLSKK